MLKAAGRYRNFTTAFIKELRYNNPKTFFKVLVDINLSYLKNVSAVVYLKVNWGSGILYPRENILTGIFFYDILLLLKAYS